MKGQAEYLRIEDKMRSGNAALAYMHTNRGTRAWFLVPGQGSEIDEAVAHKIVADADVVPSNGGLLPGITQCYRIVGAA
jgi:hypothetical protein